MYSENNLPRCLGSSPEQRECETFENENRLDAAGGSASCDLVQQRICGKEHGGGGGEGKIRAVKAQHRLLSCPRESYRGA